MDKYIGYKVVQAEPMTKGEFINRKFVGENHVEGDEQEGYVVVYFDGYESWSPKDIFEQSHLKIIANPRLKTDISISQEMVDKFIKDIDVSTICEKTTMVRVTLVNDFEIIETSACVDKRNYSEELGAEVCLKKIKDKIWMLLGFLLQTAAIGVR